jgi:hypothetical protein
MAEQEIVGDLWDPYLGLDLLRPSARVGCTTLCCSAGAPLCKIWGILGHFSNILIH